MGNNKNVEKKEVDTIVEEAEKILRCCIFRLLEKVIDQECNTGQLDFSAIPRPILEELKSIKLYLKKCEAATDSMGDFLHHRILNVIDSQLEYTLKAHQQTFHKLTQSIDLSDEFNFAYESFVRIAKRFIGDKITWYRVVSLLCFGAEISVTIIKKGGPGVQSFINRIVHYVVEFLLKERVAEWIVHHGGWMTMVHFFDSEECPNRSDHVIDLMFLTEVTSFEKWTQRIAISTILLGIGLTIWKRLLSR